jgi:hypothetical protein
MSSFLEDFYKSGRRIVLDTKQPKIKKTERPKDPMTGKSPLPGNGAHETFIKRCINDKPSKKEVVEDIKRFIEAAEANL